MAINVKIGEEEKEVESNLKFPLIARKTVDGRVFILDHPDIDIAILPQKKKVVVFAKEGMGDHVYASQNIYFDYLSKKGVILPESVKGGNVYGSLEGIIPESINEVDPIKLTLMVTAKFIEEEKEHFRMEKKYQKDQKDRVLLPDDEEATELGEVPHEEMKGAIRPGMRPYNWGGAFGVTYE